MADTAVMIPSDLAAELDTLAALAGRSRVELVVEAIARYVLEERLAIDRVVAARLLEIGPSDVDMRADQRANCRPATCGP